MARVGYQVFSDISSTVEVGSAGLPVIIYGLNWEASGGDQAVYFTSGQISGPSITDAFQTLTVSSGSYRTEMFPKGVAFPLGCMLAGDISGRATVFYTKL